MNRQTKYYSRPAFVVDPSTLSRNQGLQIAWDLLGPEYRRDAQIVKANGAAAAGATTLTVDALPVALAAGEILNFGNYAPVTVTVNDGAADAGDTSITVQALSGPIPAGTILQFSGAGAGFAKLTAAAAAAATTLTVEALPEAIDNAATATFAGGTKQARLTSPAAKGATTITVDELQFRVEDNDEAKVLGVVGGKYLPAGTVMVKVASGSFADRIVPRAVRPASESAEFILQSDAYEDSKEAALSGYGVYTGGHFFENLLPEATGSPATISSTWKTELSHWFKFDTYEDNR